MEGKGISRRARDELAGLNRIFVALLARKAPGRSHPEDGVLGLPSACALRIGRLEQDSLAWLVSCPFALCSFGFQDVEAWHALLGRQVRDTAQTGRWTGVAKPISHFLLMALGVVRELAATEAHAAAMFFGMPPVLTDSFADVGLAQLPLLAADSSSRLHARLAGHPCFWPELLSALDSRCQTRLRAATDLGLQLTIQKALRLEGSRPRPTVLCRTL